MEHAETVLVKDTICGPMVQPVLLLPAVTNILYLLMHLPSLLLCPALPYLVLPCLAEISYMADEILTHSCLVFSNSAVGVFHWTIQALCCGACLAANQPANHPAP